jgi:hypothetical protein
MKKGKIATIILMLLILLTVLTITNEDQIKSKITGKSLWGISNERETDTSSNSQETSSTKLEGTITEYKESGSLSISEEGSPEEINIVTKDKINLRTNLINKDGEKLFFTTKGYLIDPDGIKFKEFNITTNKNITLEINKTKLGYWTINLSNGSKTKNFLVAQSEDEKEIRKNTIIIQEGFKKLPNDASLADLLLNLDKKENSLLKNILKPLEQIENPLFSPLKSTTITLEPIDIKKSPAQKDGEDITVQFSMRNPEIEKEDILTVSIKNNAPLINFNFKF